LKHLGLALHHRVEGEQLAVALRAASALTTLDLDLQFLSPEERAHVVQQLSVALTSNQSLEGLKLGGDSSLADNSLADEDVFIVANVMAGFQVLNALDLSRNKLTSLAANALAAGLRDNTSLRTLDLSENGITSEGAEELLASLRVNLTLTELHLTDNKCGEDILQELEMWLRRNREPRIVLQVTAAPSPRGVYLTFFKLSGPSPEGDDARSSVFFV
jgi:Ran GTPase-activating protein (RanGAP) involved in mRNA processing and transport